MATETIRIKLPVMHDRSEQFTDNQEYDVELHKPGLQELLQNIRPIILDGPRISEEAVTDGAAAQKAGQPPIACDPSINKSPALPVKAGYERYRSKAKKLFAIALGAAALAGLGNHKGGDSAKAEHRATPVEWVAPFGTNTFSQSNLLASPNSSATNQTTTPNTLTRQPNQAQASANSAASAELGFGFFCLLSEPEQSQAKANANISKKMTEKAMGAPIVRITDGMYPWDILVKAGMHEGEIMSSLDKAAQRYKKKGGSYAWHGSGTSQWIRVFEKGKSYTDTKNVMRVLGPHLQVLAEKQENDTGKSSKSESM